MSVGTDDSLAMRACAGSRQSGVSVALIDDDVDQLKCLKAQFANFGACVTTFASGLDFLDRGCNAKENEICW